MKFSKHKKNKASVISVLRTYWIHFLFIFFLVNFVITRTLQLRFFAQSCMTQAMIDNDQRCLYVYADNVYEKGTRNSPHKGNPCGRNVTSIIPSSHLSQMVHYLDPNFVAPFCSIQPTNTPQPTIQPTSTPNPTPIPTVAPTNTPQPPSATPIQPTTAVNNPTATPIPNIPTATSKPVSATTRYIQPSPTVKPVVVNTSTPIPSILPSSIPSEPPHSGTGFGKFVGSTSMSNSDYNNSSSGLGILSPPSKPAAQKFWTSVIFWSELMTAASFILLIVSVVLSGVRFITRKQSHSGIR